MRPASVGFQCPECVAAGARTMRTGHTPVGAAVGDDAGLVTRALIVLNVGIFVLTVIAAVASGSVPTAQLGQFLAFGGPSPAYDLFAAPAQLPGGGDIASGEFYRLLTAGFLHYGLLHLALNMWALWILGKECERQLGRWRFILLYLVAGLGGAVGSYLIAAPQAAMAGASGSIFGLFGALFFLFRRTKTDVRGLVGLIVINLVFGFFIANISWQGHIGGLITGGLVGLALVYAPAGRFRTAVQLGGTALVIIALVVLVAVRTVALTGSL
jgi:membrane associated rhomboid family serine protease